MKPKPTFTRVISEHEWSVTILALALFFGSVVRILPALQTDFPINDGGMFAVMIRDLLAADLSLPEFTTYNTASIPFAYPPLAFYVGAFLQRMGMPELVLLQWLPAFFAILTLPVFYFFALTFLESRSHAALATLFFALAPGSYAWYLMGGGLTRGLGAVFLLLSLTFTRRALQGLTLKQVIPAVLFCTLTVLTHPQAALLAMAACMVLTLHSFVTQAFNIRVLSQSLIIAMGTLLFSAPWLRIVLAYHGAEVFLSAGQSGDLRISLLSLFSSLFTRQTILPFATLFWLLGLGWMIMRRRVDLAMIVLVPFFIDQRSSSIMPSFIYPLFAAWGFMDVLPACVHFVREKNWQTVWKETLFNRPVFSMSTLAIGFYLFLECVFHADVIVQLELTSEARSAMQWSSEHLETSDTVLILTGQPDAMTDPVQEWFPALTGIRSVSTLQGQEWSLSEGFTTRWLELNDLQTCETKTCVLEKTSHMGLEFNTLMFAKSAFSLGKIIPENSIILYENEDYMVIRWQGE